jgi:hypothetical protein
VVAEGEGEREREERRRSLGLEPSSYESARLRLLVCRHGPMWAGKCQMRYHGKEGRRKEGSYRLHSGGIQKGPLEVIWKGTVCQVSSSSPIRKAVTTHHMIQTNNHMNNMNHMRVLPALTVGSPLVVQSLVGLRSEGVG